MNTRHGCQQSKSVQNPIVHIDCVGGPVSPGRRRMKGEESAEQGVGKQGIIADTLSMHRCSAEPCRTHEHRHNIDISMTTLVQKHHQKQETKAQKRAERVHREFALKEMSTTQTQVTEKNKSANISGIEMRAPEGDSRIIAVGVGGWREVEVTIDSGACDIVMPVGMCPEIGVRESKN